MTDKKVWFSTGRYSEFKQLLQDHEVVWSDDMNGHTARFKLEDGRIMCDIGYGWKRIYINVLDVQYGIF